MATSRGTHTLNASSSEAWPEKPVTRHERPGQRLATSSTLQSTEIASSTPRAKTH